MKDLPDLDVQFITPLRQVSFRQLFLTLYLRSRITEEQGVCCVFKSRTTNALWFRKFISSGSLYRSFTSANDNSTYDAQACKFAQKEVRDARRDLEWRLIVCDRPITRRTTDQIQPSIPRWPIIALNARS